MNSRLDDIKQYFEDTSTSSLKTATGMINNLDISKEELLKDVNIVKIKNYIKEHIISYSIDKGLTEGSKKTLLEDFDSIFKTVLDDSISVRIVDHSRYSFEQFEEEQKNKIGG